MGVLFPCEQQETHNTLSEVGSPEKPNLNLLRPLDLFASLQNHKGLMIVLF